MGLNCGIVGLPNVGKSTIFSAITRVNAEAANYPFCTIEPNFGKVYVPDNRLAFIAECYNPEKVIPATVEFVDIAGLVKGASEGEGLGNQFLGHIRQVGAILHVVRCYDDENITHVHGKISPLDDIGVINYELCLSDLETIDKRLKNIDKYVKSQDKKVAQKAKSSIPILERMKNSLEKGVLAQTIELSPDEIDLISDLHLITMKKVIYVCNVDEAGLKADSSYFLEVKEYAKKQNNEVIKICGLLEKEINSLTIEEQKEFLKESHISETGLETLISKSYSILNLCTYFTAGKKEVRAWTFNKGNTAPEAAGIIHSDFQKGFIKAEIFNFNDLVEHKNEQIIKEKGLLRIEGKEYIVKDGDIVHFRFNV